MQNCEWKRSKDIYFIIQVTIYYHENYGIETKWLSYIKNILDSCGMSNVWKYQNQYPSEWISKSVEQKLKDQFIQLWSAEMFMSPKSLCYRLYKTNFGFEKYISLLSPNLMFILCKFRSGSHRLPVETGRWQNLPREDRLCHLCESGDIGDEFHYIMSCKFFKNERKRYLPEYCQKNINVFKFNTLFTTQNTIILEKLCKFIKIILLKVAPPGY